MKDPLGAENLHRNHRDKLRDAAIQGGLDSFEDHVLLEMLLFNSIPRRNTNDISHGLIDRFGGLKEVFGAGKNEITDFKNTGESTALFLNVLSDACKRYMQQFSLCDIYFDSVNAARKYICEDLKNQSGKVVSLLMLDANHRVKTKVTREKSEVENGSFLSDALKNVTVSRCSFAFLSFTHPNGILAPEKGEIDFINDTRKTLFSLGIKLTDAIIVTPADHRFLSDTDIFDDYFFVGQIRPNGQPISEPIS